MKFSDIGGMSVDELKKKNAQLGDELFQLKMKNLMGQLSNPLQIRATRRSIAKIATALNQKLTK